MTTTTTSTTTKPKKVRSPCTTAGHGRRASTWAFVSQAVLGVLARLYDGLLGRVGQLGGRRTMASVALEEPLASHPFPRIRLSGRTPPRRRSTASLVKSRRQVFAITRRPVKWNGAPVESSAEGLNVDPDAEKTDAIIAADKGLQAEQLMSVVRVGAGRRPRGPRRRLRSWTNRDANASTPLSRARVASLAFSRRKSWHHEAIRSPNSCSRTTDSTPLGEGRIDPTTPDASRSVLARRVAVVGVAWMRAWPSKTSWVCRRVKPTSFATLAVLRPKTPFVRWSFLTIRSTRARSSWSTTRAAACLAFTDDLLKAGLEGDPVAGGHCFPRPPVATSFPPRLRRASPAAFHAFRGAPEPLDRAHGPRRKRGSSGTSGAASRPSLTHPWIPTTGPDAITVRGFVYDVDTGLLSEVSYPGPTGSIG